MCACLREVVKTECNVVQRQQLLLYDIIKLRIGIYILYFYCTNDFELDLIYINHIYILICVLFHIIHVVFFQSYIDAIFFISRINCPQVRITYRYLYAVFRP